MPLRLVFFGTPEFALPSLRLLLADSNFQVEAVVTQPDRPSGRGQHVTSSPVKQLALNSGLHLLQPKSVRDESTGTFLRQTKPDAVVIIAYGQIIPSTLLEIPRLGWINLHGSLLPKYRGAAPIHWAIANGETHTGLTTMKVDAGMDTGPILLRKEIEIGPDETSPALSLRMAEVGAPLVANTLLGLERGEISPTPQDNARKSLAPLLKKEDGLLDWSLPAQSLYNRIRGFDPWPGAYTWFRGQHCRVWGRPQMSLAATTESVGEGAMRPGSLATVGGELVAACGEKSWLRVDEVQLEGKKRVSAKEFANGARLNPADTFTSNPPVQRERD